MEERETEIHQEKWETENRETLLQSK